MNRNIESHFSQLPSANIGRSIFDRSNDIKTSLNAGRLIPFYLDEVLPGDTFDITTSKVVRSQTLLTPIMDNMYLDTYWFFVPNRLTWKHWIDFCGENTEGAWAVKKEWSIPRISSPVMQSTDKEDVVIPWKPGTIADYFGLPVADTPTADTAANMRKALEKSPVFDLTSVPKLTRASLSALPFRAYALICNEFFRDENLSDPLFVSTDDANQVGSNGDDEIKDVANGGMPYRVAKYHDYFTSCLPQAQKGDPVQMPVVFGGSNAYLPVITRPNNVIPDGLYGDLDHKIFSQNTQEEISALRAKYGYYGFGAWPLRFFRSGEGIVPSHTTDGQSANFAEQPFPFYGPDGNSPDLHWNYFRNGNASLFLGVNSPTGSPKMAGTNGTDLEANKKLVSNALGSSSYPPLVPANLWALFGTRTQVEAGLTGSFSINEFRLAYAYQTYLEQLARSGSRYGELILGLFGVRNPDERIQRPEYLGGNRVPIVVNEVLNTAQSDSDPLGDTGAMSSTSDVHHDFIKSFTEHGFVIGVCCVRYDHTYGQGVEKMWTRETFEDFYNPKFAQLGEMPVYKYQLFANGDTMSYAASPERTTFPVFGYQEAWAEYRYKPSYYTGEMRPGVKNSLSYWHLGDNYADAPSLSSDWIREDPKTIDRVLAVSSDVSNQFWANIYVKNRCTRCMPMYSIPGLEPKF